MDNAVSHLDEAVFGRIEVDGRRVLRGFAYQARGMPTFLAVFRELLRGRNRGIENDALRRLELYVKENAAPDPASDLPVATGPALPLSTGALADGSYYVLVVRRNGYDVDSGNRDAVRVDVVSGEAAPGPVGPVELVSVVATDYELVIRAAYFEREEEAPTRWRVVVEQGGESDQVFTPGLDTSGDGVAVLDQLVSVARSAGVVAVRVRAERVVEDVSGPPGPDVVVPVEVPGDVETSVRGLVTDEVLGIVYYPEG